MQHAFLLFDKIKNKNYGSKLLILSPYASSLPLTISLPLYMACDDGCDEFMWVRLKMRLSATWRGNRLGCPVQIVIPFPMLLCRPLSSHCSPVFVDLKPELAGVIKEYKLVLTHVSMDILLRVSNDSGKCFVPANAYQDPFSQKMNQTRLQVHGLPDTSGRKEAHNQLTELTLLLQYSGRLWNIITSSAKRNFSSRLTESGTDTRPNASYKRQNVRNHSGYENASISNSGPSYNIDPSTPSGGASGHRARQTNAMNNAYQELINAVANTLEAKEASGAEESVESVKLTGIDEYRLLVIELLHEDSAQ
ncbi:hypothetical protein Tco_0883902 [Tanacetum coccineum]